MYDLPRELTYTYLYLVVANIREGLAVSKQAAQKFDVERFNLMKAK